MDKKDIEQRETAPERGIVDESIIALEAKVKAAEWRAEKAEGRNNAWDSLVDTAGARVDLPIDGLTRVGILDFLVKEIETLRARLASAVDAQNIADTAVKAARGDRDAARASLAEADQHPAAEVWVVFDGPPGAESGRFIETEDGNGHGAGGFLWQVRADGLWQLGPFYRSSTACSECARLLEVLRLPDLQTALHKVVREYAQPHQRELARSALEVKR